MNWVDVDVIAKPQNIVGGVEDRRLKSFRRELENQNALAREFKVANRKLFVKDVTDVYDMVTRILSGIGKRPIRRLRIFGHGSPHTIQMGPFRYTGRGVQALSPLTAIDPNDRDKIIQIVLTPKLRYELVNQPSLEKLKGHFDSRGWVELQSCRVMGVWGDGNKLIEGLSDLWNVAVQASDARQVVGGGFEGDVWQATPGRKAERIRVQPKTSSLTPASRAFLAVDDPLKRALENLKLSSTAGAGPTRGRAVVSAYQPVKVGSLSQRSQMEMTKKLFRPFAVNPSPEARAARNDPLGAALAGIRKSFSAATARSTMLPGTTYSDINTGKTFRIDRLGRHLDTGMIKGFPAKPGSSLISRTLHARNDPLQNAFDSLKPRSRTGLPMLPGTTYSDLSTRRTYRVDSLGRHVQTGSLQGVAAGYGTGATARTFRASYDPLRDAVRRLGG